MEVDHINGNTLDNQLENLRLCDRSHNAQNMRRIKAGHMSRYRGVCLKKGKTTKPWVSQIEHNLKKEHLGYYATEEEAALRYNQRAIELFGNGAYINNIKERNQ